MDSMFDLLATGQIKPLIAERLPLEGVVHAHELLENAEVQGKLVLIPNQ
jgi:NADPH:quinone reductase